MVIVLIRRSVRPEKEAAFLEAYNREKPDHADFVSETLTKVSNSNELPDSMRSLPIGGDGVTYVNVATWKSARSFEEYFEPRTMHDPEIECGDRVRVVLEVC